MLSLKKLSAVLAVSLPLVAAAQPAAEPPPAAPPAAAPAPAAPPPAPAAAPAAAKPPLYQWYGTLNINVQSTELTHATNSAGNQANRLAVSIDSTNIGIKGAADVAYGLGVVYQCETSAALDGIATNSICNRNSRLGLSSTYGTLFLGNWDTPFKASYGGTKADDPFGNTDVFAQSNLMGSPGFRTRSVAGKSAIDQANASFDLRAQNAIAYHSPKFMGASFKLQHSVNEFAADSTAAADGDLSPMLWSAVVNLDAGPFSVFGSYERHDDYWGLNAINGAIGQFHPEGGTATTALNSRAQSTVDSAWRAGAGYELGSPFGATTVGVQVEQLMYEQEKAAAGALKEYNRMAYQVSLKHRTGNHELRARYNLADQGDCKFGSGSTASCRTKGYGAQNVALGYAYHLAKSTQVYAFYSKIENESRAEYTFSVAGASQVVGTGAYAATVEGADPWAAGVGMRYAF